MPVGKRWRRYSANLTYPHDILPRRKKIEKILDTIMPVTVVSLTGVVNFLNPVYVGNDANTGNAMLFTAKSVRASELQPNYGALAEDDILLDEYDRAPTLLIHLLDSETGDVQRIGFNNYQG